MKDFNFLKICIVGGKILMKDCWLSVNSYAFNYEMFNSLCQALLPYLTIL